MLQRRIQVHGHTDVFGGAVGGNLLSQSTNSVHSDDKYHKYDSWALKIDKLKDSLPQFLESSTKSASTFIDPSIPVTVLTTTIV